MNKIALKHFPIKENEVPSRFICLAKESEAKRFYIERNDESRKYRCFQRISMDYQSK